MLSNLVSWAASHLVALGLLAYLIAGLGVFGVIPWPSGWSAGENRGPAPQASAPSDARPGAAVEPGAAEERPLPRKGPRLIGGSLPVYESPVAAPPSEPPTAGRAGDGFRPRSASPVGDEPDLTRDGLVQRARRAFWNGDPEGAEVAYLDLIAAHPGDADAFGELGNLYESLGRPEAARDAFFEAGIRLKASGDNENLNKIIELLKRAGDPRVDQLTR